MALRIALLLCVCLLFGGSANGAATTTYYVSATGTTRAPGRRRRRRGRTLAKVNNTRLQPGDSVLLEGRDDVHRPRSCPGLGRRRAAGHVRVVRPGPGDDLEHDQQHRLPARRLVRDDPEPAPDRRRRGMHVIVSDPRRRERLHHDQERPDREHGCVRDQLAELRRPRLGDPGQHAPEHRRDGHHLPRVRLPRARDLIQ